MGPEFYCVRSAFTVGQVGLAIGSINLVLKPKGELSTSWLLRMFASALVESAELS